PESLSVERLTELALARRPDLSERAAASRQARALASLARREAMPSLELRGVSEPDEAGGRFARAGVGITVPLFNRNRGEEAARLAEAEQADLEQAALFARTRAEIARAIAAYGTAWEQAETLRTTVLAPARENRQLLEIAYRAGKVGLPVLLLIRNQVIDAELEYWEAWLAAREALTDLREATAETVVAAPGP
ncbi:MAG: TolC family protein, partial [Thermoanaerobaculia bacterium]